MSDTDVDTARTRCPECGFEVPPDDNCSLCGHGLDGTADPA